MALGRRKNERQQDFWVATTELPRSEGHVFYQKLNELLREAGFDEFVESLCEEHYHDTMGRPGIPPGTYFRMLMVGYFEGIGSQRGIAWRCADSLSLRVYLGVGPTEKTPDHSSMTRVRDRLPLKVHQSVFRFILQLASEKGLLKGKTVAVDATTLEANAAMKSIVRRDSGEDWQEYIKRLMLEAGEIEETDDPTAEEIARFDKKRKDKKVSNQDWESQTDSDSRIAKMKDGRTHLAYKAEHTIDLETELILSAEVYHADQSDGQTIGSSVTAAQDHLIQAEIDAQIAEVVADKGYHTNEVLSDLEFTEGLRTYIAEPKQTKRRNWKNKPDEQQQAFRNNHRRVKGDRGRALQRQRSERVERSFAHVCGSGGSRRAWLHGLEKVKKRHLMSAMTRNLGLVMRKLFGFGTAKSLQGHLGLAGSSCFAWIAILARVAFRVASRNRAREKTHREPFSSSGIALAD
jgi:transposase